MLYSKCIFVCSLPGRRGAPAADRPRGNPGGVPGSAGGEAVAVLIQAGEGAEVDHGARVALTLAQGVSLVTD